MPQRWRTSCPPRVHSGASVSKSVSDTFDPVSLGFTDEHFLCEALDAPYGVGEFVQVPVNGTASEAVDNELDFGQGRLSGYCIRIPRMKKGSRYIWSVASPFAPLRLKRIDVTLL